MCGFGPVFAFITTTVVAIFAITAIVSIIAIFTITATIAVAAIIATATVVAVIAVATITAAVTTAFTFLVVGLRWGFNQFGRRRAACEDRFEACPQTGLLRGLLRHLHRCSRRRRRRFRFNVWSRLQRRDAFHCCFNAHFVGFLLDRFYGINLLWTLNHLVAGRHRFGGVQLVVLQALNRVVRRFKIQVRDQNDADFEARFERLNVKALFVQQIRRNVDRHLCHDLRAVVLHRFFLDDAQDVQRDRFRRADVSRAVAAWARQMRAFAERWLQALTRKLHQTKARNLAELNAGTIKLHRVAQLVFNIALMLARLHVDEIDHDQTAEITQAKLARHFISGFQVRVECRRFDVAALGGTR